MWKCSPSKKKLEVVLKVPQAQKRYTTMHCHMKKDAMAKGVIFTKKRGLCEGVQYEVAEIS